MAKIVINGETFDYDGAKQPLQEALWIEHVYKRRYGEWQDDLGAGSAKALVMMACLIWRRDGRNVDTAFQDILDGKTEFDFAGMLRSVIDAGAAALREAEAAEPGPTIPGTPPGQDGSPTTGTATSGSSPSTSTSGRGKSGSSKSRTTKSS